MTDNTATPPDGGAATIEERLEQRFSESEQPATLPKQDAETSEEPENPTDDEQNGEEQQDGAFELDADQLASIFGTDPSNIQIGDDGSLKFRTKIDGQEGVANLAELIKSYQLESHLTRRSEQLAEQRRSLEAEAQAARQAFSDQLTQASSLLNTVEQQLLSEYQSIDWQRLRRENPAEYAAAQADYGARAQHVQALKQQAMQQQAELQQQQQAVTQQQVQAEYAALLESLPDWRDPAKAQAEAAEIQTFLRGRGFDDNSISTLVDHRQILLVRDAMLYRKSLEGSKLAEKKITHTARPVLKPGARMDGGDAKALAAKAARDRLKKSGKTDDVAALLLNRL